MNSKTEQIIKCIVFLLITIIIISPVSGAPVKTSTSSAMASQLADKVSENSEEAEEPVQSGGGVQVIEVEVTVDLVGMQDAADGTLDNLGKNLMGKNSGGTGGGIGGGVGGGEDSTPDKTNADTESSGGESSEDSSKTKLDGLGSIGDIGDIVSEGFGSGTSAPSLIQMEVDVAWDKKDTTNTIKKTIKKANSEIFSDGGSGNVGGGTDDISGIDGASGLTDGPFGSVGGGGGGSFINHAESLMDSAIKFAAEAFHGEGANERNLGIGGGVGGGSDDYSNNLEKTRYVNFYFKNADDIEIVMNETDENYVFDVIVSGKNVMKGLKNGRLVSDKYNETINNLRWFSIDMNEIPNQTRTNELLNSFIVSPAYARQVEDDPNTMKVIEMNSVGMDEAVEMTESFYEICDHFTQNSVGSGFNCFYDDPVHDSTGTPFSVDGEEIHKFGITEMLIRGTANDIDAKYQYIFTPIKDSGTGVFDLGKNESLENLPSFIMTDVDDWISEEDKNSCITLKAPGGNKKLCYSTELNGKKNMWGSGDINEEEAKKTQNIIQQMPEVVNAVSPQDDYNNEVGRFPNFIEFINSALAKIVKDLYEPNTTIKGIGDKVFSSVLAVATALVPLAIILTIAISMRNGASSASGIAETRTFFIDLIVSIGLAVSSHFIIQQTTAIGTAIAGKIAGSREFRINSNLFQADNALQGILLLIIGILFVFLMVAILIEVYLAALAMQAHYVILCAFSPIMLVMSAYKPFKSLRDQWFKMVLHGMIIAPANAIVLAIMNTIAGS